MALKFKLISSCYQDATLRDKGDVDFMIEVDNWNDFGYCTTYHLHASKRLTRNTTRYLGFMNIMMPGQKASDGIILAKAYKINEEIFTELPNDVISISFSQDLYRGLSKVLTAKDQRIAFVNALHMLFGEDDPRYKDLAEDECFTTSILRNASMDSFALRKGKQYMFDEAVFYDFEKQKIKVQYAKADREIELDFNTPAGEWSIEEIPYGMIAFIGHNGCGKSTLLYLLAKLLYMSPTYRIDLQNEIKIEPNDVGISKLLLFSYSAFDNFLFPGRTVADYRLMAAGVESREGRFVYCGVRDVKQEIEGILKKHLPQKGEESKAEDERIIIKNERLDEIRLKPVNMLAAEFDTALTEIFRDRDKKRLWDEMLQRCEEKLPSLYADIFTLSIERTIFGSNAENAYMRYSTGVKFFLHTMSHIIAYNEDNSLLLFDEPENHLHPPMLSFMMNEIRIAIRETHSVMLVSTHSPVILQEMFAKNIYVVDRHGERLSFSKPDTETYGENFGYINNLVFHLNSDISNFHDLFDDLYIHWHCENIDSIDELIALYQHRLGCESLSSQMVAYLVNKHLNERTS